MTNSQKAKKYGASSGASPARSGRRGPQARGLPDESLRAEPGKSSSPAVVVGAVLLVGLAIWAYYHAVILPRLAETIAQGMAAPELHFSGFGQQYAADFARALGEQGLSEYTGVHATTGLFAPLLFTLGVLLFLGLNTANRALKWLFWLVALAYALVFVVGNRALEDMLANPQDAGLVATGSALVIARWALLAAMVVIALIVNIMVVRQKLSDFAEGKLPGQRPRK